MAATVAALGVAAHEAGHAVQDARGYRPMQHPLRRSSPPPRSARSCGSSRPSSAAFLGSTGLVNVGLVLFLAVVIFQLVTLPVEFDASHRAIVALEGGGLLGAEELSGARKVLQSRGPHLRGRARRLDRSADLLLHRLAAVMIRPLGVQ